MADPMERGRLLSVRRLEVDHRDRDRGVLRPLLKGVDLDLHRGQALALVGPSGCGKSLTARALLGLLTPDFAWRGEIRWRGTRLSKPRGETWRQVRGRGLGLILQEPLANLNPVLRVGDQIAEGRSATETLQDQHPQRDAVGVNHSCRRTFVGVEGFSEIWQRE